MSQSFAGKPHGKEFARGGFRSTGRRSNQRGNRCSSIFGYSFKPTEQELAYLEAAEYGDIPTVRKMINESTNLNINCVDYMGQNALQLACGNEHLEVVEILIKQRSMSRIGDALLLAISRGYFRIVEAILTHPSVQGHLTRSSCEQSRIAEEVEEDFFACDDEGTRFSSDITPIILAAQCQEFDIVHDFLRKGARIEHPHHCKCRCRECTSRQKKDSLRFCLSRLNAYKGLASPAYLSLASPDPALQALKLSHELTELASVEKEFKNDYIHLASQCNNFVERLLDLCRDTSEVDAILNGSCRKTCNSSLRNSICSLRKACNNHNHSDERRLSKRCQCELETYPKLRQLKLAIEYKVKKFVAHPNCQQKLIGIWNNDVDWLRQVSVIHKFLLAFILSMFMPLLAVIYLFAPCSKIGRILQSPVCKFATQGMAYAQFVFLLMINCLERMESFQSTPFLRPFLHKPFSEGRHTSFNWCEKVTVLYIAGLLWNEMKELWHEGARNYIFKLWNIVDFFMLLILIGSFSCRAVAYHKANVGQEWWEERFGNNATEIHYDLQSGNTTLLGENIELEVPLWAGYYAYSRKDRSYWRSSDPQLVAEALFSYGMVLSFSRICYILEVNEKFGPLQISLARTVTDIIKWCGIFFIIFGSFMLGLFNLYASYRVPGAKKHKSFTTLEETFITLFWSLFGLADYKVVEVKYDHQLTRIVGYQLYGAYNIVTVVVMLNMLIAMINSSYSEVEGDSDVEWKFARAELMLSYFEQGNTLPVPYNLLPMPIWIYSTIMNAINRLRFRYDASSSRDCGSKTKSSFEYNFDMSDFRRRESCLPQPRNSEDKSTYEVIIGRIVKRFVLRAQVEKNKNNEITETELQEIKHDISSLRYEMLGTTQRNEEKLNSMIELLAEQKQKATSKATHEISPSFDDEVQQRM